MPGAEQVCDAQGDRYSEGANAEHPQCAGAQGGRQAWVANGHLRSGDEHHEREADVGEQRKRHIRGMQDAKTGVAEGDAGQQLAKQDG